MGFKARSREGGPPQTQIVVDDATQWSENSARTREALYGVLAAIERVYGVDGIRELNECGLVNIDVGLRPMDFAGYVISGQPAEEGDNPWSN
ncbi:MAG: hypothetical protein JSV86_16870 [Gemmatimonadota bacterium]|nr:MAG: hypothetical protein JSV86_16870 [Gemmatimonadota bacterium]